MNFLLRSTHQAAVEQVPSAKESSVERQYVSRPTTTEEGLIAEDPLPQYSILERNGETHGVGSENGSSTGPTSKNDSVATDYHSDVSEEGGWITIPKIELPDDWNNATDICSLRSLDRSFVFGGEQVHVLACLSAFKQDTEIITPFKVAAMMNKNGSGQSREKQNGEVKNGENSVSSEKKVSPDGQVIDENCENPPKEKTDPQKDISASESILRMEDHRRQTEMLLQRFKDSHFFVRIVESGELLWMKKDASKVSSESLGVGGQRSVGNGINAIIDTGKFDANVSGGVARNSIQCYSLSSGDIVVLLKVNVGVNYLRNPIIEILQFEKFLEKSSEKQENILKTNNDPCRDLLKWLLPLDNNLTPPARSLSPPPLNSSTGIGGASQKSTFAASSESQLFSFGHFRSYSMSSLPQNTPQSAAPVKAQSSKPSFDLEDWNHDLSQKFLKNQRTGSEGLLSFRGVSLEQERFYACCGLEGIYIPGRRWRRKIEIVQPVEIHSFAADCNADDLICVRIKNISPTHAPDIVVYVDAISIVFEEAAKGGPPSSLPIACIEAGNEHSLPNLALRKGEEHSFILKPASCMWKTLKVHGEKGSQLMNLHLPSSTVEGRRIASNDDRYAIMVSCRCNYTESRLFFKQPTSWRPHMSRDIMISVASEMSGKSSGSNGRVSQLPVQVLTLQASNLSSEDLTLTVLAPASFTSPPTVGSLSSPSSPLSPFINASEFRERVKGEGEQGTAMQRLNSAPPAIKSERQASENDVRSASSVEQSTPVSDVINSGLGCTHLWLQSRIPLGCVPSKSAATIKLELLPLTDGIITLDTLQVEVKEKGWTYIPEQSLKINVTSSISTGIM